MRFVHEAVVSARPEDLWALVEDLGLLAACIPGATGVEVTGPDRFTAVVDQHVGPIGLSLETEVRLTELDPPARAVIDLAGFDRRLGARVRQHQVITLEPVRDGTRVRVDADVQLTGRLATFGQRVVEVKARELAQGLLANIEARVRPASTFRPGGATAGEEAAEPG